MIHPSVLIIFAAGLFLHTSCVGSNLSWTSDDPEIIADRSAKFEDRLTFLVNLGFVALEGDIVTYLGSL